VDLPPGAQILKATLKICAHASGLGGQISAVIRAEAADDTGEFSSSHRANSVTMTDASQAWDWAGTTWTQDTWYESPDISHVIQEVVDRPGWSPSNAIALICAADGNPSSDRKFWSHDGDPERAARLEITYQP
jgi:type IV pilus assembly protein PilY1